MMKTHVLATLVGLATGFVVPATAQEKEEVNPQILQLIEANDKAYDEAFNKHDAAAIAALYSENAVLMTPDGVFTGQGDIEKRYTLLLEQTHCTDHVNKLDQVHTPLGVNPWAVGSWTAKHDTTPYTGFRFLVYVPAPAGGAWKVSTEVIY